LSKLAEKLAAECAPNTADADKKLDEVLRGIGLSRYTVVSNAQTQKAKELVQEYARHEPDAVTLIDELLTDASVSLDSLTVDALAEKLDYIERLDHLTTTAESRRDASLHEIVRHRAVLGEALRRSVQEIESSELEVIDTTPVKGKHAH
jgi:hypothetical protein